MRTENPRFKGEKGLAIIMTGLMLVPLMVFAAFGVDMASWYSRISQLQKAADAAALAGTVWMPNLNKASDEAEASLRTNGFVDGVNGIVVDIDRGSTPTSLRVELTDTDADRIFSQVFRGQQRLTRHAEAEYNLPIPLGSPLNYFGGDASKNTTTEVFSVAWPSDYQTRIPWNLDDTGGDPDYEPTEPCRISDRSEFGGWAGSPPTWSAGNYNGSWQLCVWSARPNEPGSLTNVPVNTPCNVFGRDTDADGRWANASTYQAGDHYTGGSTGNRQCYWNLPGLLPPDFQTRRPTNIPCNDLGLSGGGYGRWRTNSGGSHQGNNVYSASSTSGKLCEWTAELTSTDVPTPNQIDPGRSPNLWAQIHGPGGNQQSGDAYSTRCVVDTNCGTPDNDLYTDASNPNQGYWYVVKIPPGGGGSTTIRIFDAQLTPGALADGTGDSVISGSNMSFSTNYRVYKQTNPLDFNARTPVTVSGANQTPNSCNWSIQQQAEFRLQWVDLCTVNAVAGEIYLINVRSDTISGVSNSAGRNGYAVEACTGGTCTGAGQPALYAYDKMVIYNNISSGDATFYIAEVGPQYAGKTLVLELFDPGEHSGTAWMYPQTPSETTTGAVDPVPLDECEFESTRSGYPRASDLGNGGVCSIRTASSGALYNGHWVTMRVQIPTDYDCTVGINPEVDPDSCWWGIRYSFTGGGQPTDTTTWQARIEGNPLQLTQ